MLLYYIYISLLYCILHFFRPCAVNLTSRIAEVTRGFDEGAWLRLPNGSYLWLGDVNQCLRI